MTRKTLILTILAESEAKAIRAVFGVMENPVDEIEGNPIYKCSLRSYSNNDIYISCAINKGNTELAIITPYLLDKIKPEKVILIGTCAGRKDKTKIGDVVVANEIYDYGQSVLEKGNEIRFTSEPCSDVLSKKFNILKSDENLRKKWLPIILENLLDLRESINRRLDVEFFNKDIATGSLIIDENRMGILVEKNANIYAADQESMGFAKVCKRKNTDWIVVRGVSDFGDRDTRKKNALFATVSAAALVKMYLLEEKTNVETITENYDTKIQNELRNLLGCSQIWVPTKNNEMEINQIRNKAKTQAIQESGESIIRLVAQTGYSFLANRSVFYNEVYKHLKKGGLFHIVLTDSCSKNVLFSKEESEKIKSKYEMALDGYSGLK